MHYHIAAADIARKLTTRHHSNTLTGPEWQPGHRAQQASRTTVRIWHDGPDEAAHLHQYAAVLQGAGYTVTTERPAGKRPSLKITRQGKETP